MRLAQAHHMWLRLRSVSRCQSVYRTRARRVHEKQSTPPADQVAQRVARQRVAGQQHRVDEEDHADRGRSAAARPGVVRANARTASSHRKNSGMNARYRK